MTRTPKILADAQLPNTQTAAYTVPASTSCIVSSISLVNTDVAAQTINVWVKKSGGTARLVSPKDHSLAAGARYADVLAYALATGDSIEWQAQTAAKVDGLISGTELA